MKTISSLLNYKTLLQIYGFSLIFMVCINANAQYDPNFELRINAGGPEISYQDKTFLADQSYVNGYEYTNSQASVDPLYSNERYRTSLTYEIPLENGDYNVILHYAEIYWGANGGGAGGVGDRVFDVSIEGQLMLDNFDISTEVSPETPLLKSFTVNVSDGVLNIYHSALAVDGGVGHAKISALEILGINAANTNPGTGSGSGDSASLWSKTGSNISYESGNVGIGTEAISNYMLAVDGKVRSREVKVDVDNWPDYVFNKNHNLPTLEEVKTHIEQKGHLINIPTAKEVEASGIELGEMNRLLLEKIEELTLYLIENNRKVQELELSNKNLLDRLQKMEFNLQK
ncbi:malectin domain-containing carbohydrate-binding protein [Zobellia laminariae]|uniref:malectin domain-containing carbohydrate-binding protein n=1 Tax=Zobellia laminariae TaxID=248906 RepID=UPI0012D87C2D|nr:hypothetical protein [Zobellia laminariae]